MDQRPPLALRGLRIQRAVLGTVGNHLGWGSIGRPSASRFTDIWSFEPLHHPAHTVNESGRLDSVASLLDRRQMAGKIRDSVLHRDHHVVRVHIGIEDECLMNAPLDLRIRGGGE
jgi:hypothetical protein